MPTINDWVGMNIGNAWSGNSVNITTTADTSWQGQAVWVYPPAETLAQGGIIYEGGISNARQWDFPLVTEPPDVLGAMKAQMRRELEAEIRRELKAEAEQKSSEGKDVLVKGRKFRDEVDERPLSEGSTELPEMRL